MKLPQVRFNLLTNALKFTPRVGHIEVTARLQGDEVVIISLPCADSARRVRVVLRSEYGRVFPANQMCF
jgi:signal transduction histidine kinase